MQHGYYFEIMLPGACVGAIVGWATQRYGRPVKAAVASAMMLVMTLFALSARAAEVSGTGDRGRGIHEARSCCINRK